MSFFLLLDLAGFVTAAIKNAGSKIAAYFPKLNAVIGSRKKIKFASTKIKTIIKPQMIDMVPRSSGKALAHKRPVTTAPKIKATNTKTITAISGKSTKAKTKEKKAAKITVTSSPPAMQTTTGKTDDLTVFFLLFCDAVTVGTIIPPQRSSY